VEAKKFFDVFLKIGGSGFFWKLVKIFELSNHLGNVLVTISDKKLAVSANGTTVDYYTADVVTAGDYYPGGMQMPGRKYTSGSSSYRYSINGQEKESELNENITTAQFWEYDSRIGRRWNIDPVTKDDESPYLTFGGNPIVMMDPDGDDWYKNKKSGSVDWFEGSGKHKGYGKSLGATYDGYTNGTSGKHWMNGDANGTKVLWLDPVTVTAKRKVDNSLMASYGMMHNGYITKEKEAEKN
jgi:hypothetical protein